MIATLKEQAVRLLRTRAQNYRRVFDTETVAGVKVLEDLSKYCRAHETTFLPDERASAVLEGRRDVWLRIQQHLQLTDEQLWELFK